MSLFQAFILGLIQGLTEFIPVSSSGHLVLMHHAFGALDYALAFDVALHAGTLTALLVYFWRDVLALIRSLFVKSEVTHLAHLLIIATIPAAFFGYLLGGVAESRFRSPVLVACTMLVFGLIMLGTEWLYQRNRTHDALKNVTLKEALAMGLAQAVALIPGVSRSGSTITTGLLTGLERVAATRFSFLLGIPITFGAIVKVLTEDRVIEHLGADPAVIIVGVVTATLSGLFAIRFMIRYLGKHGLHVFAYYRIGLAIVTLVALGIR